MRKISEELMPPPASRRRLNKNPLIPSEIHNEASER